MKKLKRGKKVTDDEIEAVVQKAKKEIKVEKVEQEEPKAKVKGYKKGDEVTTPDGDGVVGDVMYVKDGTVFAEALDGCEVRVAVSVNGVHKTYEESTLK